MQLRALALAGMVLASGHSVAGTDNGDFCQIPTLEQGVASTLEVPYIDKPFCGTAIIDKRYVRMSDFAKATEDTEPQCASDSFCTRVMRFYRDEEKSSTPYILIFHGPRHRKAV